MSGSWLSGTPTVLPAVRAAGGPPSEPPAQVSPIPNRANSPEGAPGRRLTSVKVYLAPVGCPKATVDLEKSAWAMAADGFQVVPSPSEASAVIVFACGFIDDAKKEAINEILSYAESKARGAIGRVIVAGCMPEKYAGELARAVPEVDAWVGNSCLDSLPAVLRSVLAGRAGRRVWRRQEFAPRPCPAHRCLPASAPWTRTVMICDGCSNGCTYCAIPHMRGCLRSRDAAEILAEARLLVSQGAQEIVLAGQDIASYGRDQGVAGLSDLVRGVAARSGAHWIRLSYANPDNLQASIAEVIARHGNICRYIDMPIQHASPSVLERMGRCSDPEAILAKIENLRLYVPDIAIRTTVIVGFPGETEADFEALLGFLKAVRFDMAGVFGFSPQPGTPAASLGGRISDDLKCDRVADVVSLQHGITLEKTRSMVGRTLEVLVEETLPDRAARGRSQYDMAEVDRSIRLEGVRVNAGEYTTAKITGSTDAYELIGVARGISR